ncbi:hypothetical protein QBC46DRAFT_411334 [Diplogelasinospora grovesii]|uniref:Uncharacterized protein n=1 Tax=Diplogelasinospora grovesii TaxID=303347 RepID=A0AAN6S0Z2_9PEZI|nr:hypothetical protein QBC46DRAFT_411334 [Diplogelasinospora grovesii]
MTGPATGEVGLEGYELIITSYLILYHFATWFFAFFFAQGNKSLRPSLMPIYAGTLISRWHNFEPKRPLASLPNGLFRSTYVSSTAGCPLIKSHMCMAYPPPYYGNTFSQTSHVPARQNGRDC